MIAQGIEEPIPYADVTLMPGGPSVFADAKGRFVISGAPSGPLQLRARRVGFSPTTVAVAANVRSDTIRVHLSSLVLQMERVRVSASVCGNDFSSLDTAVVAILEQLRIGAERNRLLVRDYPFESTLERQIADAGMESGVIGSRSIRHVVRIDTISLPSDPAWRYAPGQLVLASNDTLRGVYGSVVIPQLVDFADEPFVATHCFRYAGLGSVDGERAARIEFEPAKSIREPDVSGTLYLDPTSYRLRRTSLTMVMPSPAAPNRDELTMQVDTWFRDLLPGLPLIERVCQRTTARFVGDRQPPSQRLAPGSASIEEQRLLSVDFRDALPAADTTLRAATGPAKNVPCGG